MRRWPVTAARSNRQMRQVNSFAPVGLWRCAEALWEHNQILLTFSFLRGWSSHHFLLDCGETPWTVSGVEELPPTVGSPQGGWWGGRTADGVAREELFRLLWQ